MINKNIKYLLSFILLYNIVSAQETNEKPKKLEEVFIESMSKDSINFIINKAIELIPHNYHSLKHVYEGKYYYSIEKDSLKREFNAEIELLYDSYCNKFDVLDYFEDHSGNTEEDYLYFKSNNTTSINDEMIVNSSSFKSSPNLNLYLSGTPHNIFAMDFVRNINIKNKNKDNINLIENLNCLNFKLLQRQDDAYLFLFSSKTKKRCNKIFYSGEITIDKNNYGIVSIKVIQNEKENYFWHSFSVLTEYFHQNKKWYLKSIDKKFSQIFFDEEFEVKYSVDVVQQYNTIKTKPVSEKFKVRLQKNKTPLINSISTILFKDN